jgi:hypothetical protein
MKPVLLNSTAIIGGLVLGSLVNMGITSSCGDLQINNRICHWHRIFSDQRHDGIEFTFTNLVQCIRSDWCIPAHGVP